MVPATLAPWRRAEADDLATIHATLMVFRVWRFVQLAGDVIFRNTDIIGSEQRHVVRRVGVRVVGHGAPPFFSSAGYLAVYCSALSFAR